MKLSTSIVLMGLALHTPASTAIQPGLLDILGKVDKGSDSSNLRRKLDGLGLYDNGDRQGQPGGGGDRDRCNPEDLTGLFSGGPVCLVIGGNPAAPELRDCFDFPATTDTGTVTQYMDLAADANGIVTGEWGVLINDDPAAEGSFSEELVGLIDPNDCTFTLVETFDQGFFTGTLGKGFVTYKHIQPGESHVVQNGRLNKAT